MNIKKIAAVSYLDAIGDYAECLSRRYEDYSLVQKLIETLIAEQRERVKQLLAWCDPHGTPDAAVNYSVFSSQEIESMARTFYDLFIDKAAADMMRPNPESIDETIQEIQSGELKRKINRVTRCRLIDAGTGAVRCSHCFSDKCGDFIAAVGWMRDADSDYKEAAQWEITVREQPTPKEANRCNHKKNRVKRTVCGIENSL